MKIQYIQQKIDLLTVADSKSDNAYAWYGPKEDF